MGIFYGWATGSAEIGKAYYGWETGQAQLGKGYYGWETGQALVYSSEETVINNLTLETAATSGSGDRKTQTSQSYTASGYDTLTITGSATETITDLGEYGPLGVVTLQGSTNGSTWVDLSTLLSKNFNATNTTAINTEVAISGYSYFRIYLLIENAANATHSNGKISVTNLTAIAK